MLGTSYGYDADGRRVTKTSSGVTTAYVYDVTGQLAAQYTTAGTGTAPCPAATCYLMTDHLGSTRMQTNSSGLQLMLFDYAPFGEELAGYDGRDARWGGFGSGIHFTGKEQEGAEGAYMHYLGARYFSAGWGRFTSPDDFRNDSAAQDPQTWNPYSYGRNNPLRYWDPDGLAVNVCLNDENGNQSCTLLSNDQYAAAVGGNNPGIDAPAVGPGFGSQGVLYGLITCGGEVCGSATYQEESMPDTSGDLLITAQVGRGIAAGLANLGGSLFRAGARFFAAEAGSTVARVAPDLVNLSPKILKDMEKRGWTKQELEETVRLGTKERAIDRTAGGTPATRYTNPATGKALTVNYATGKIIKVGDVGFTYDTYKP